MTQWRAFSGPLAEAASDLQAVAQGYEAWEAELIRSGDWRDGLPKLTQPLYDRLMELQVKRNAALAKARGQS